MHDQRSTLWDVWERRLPVAALAVALSLSCAAGCGDSGKPPPRAVVAGKVTVDGQPLTDGAVLFDPADRGPRARATVKDGSYSLSAQSGAIIGRNKVRIEGYRETGRVYQPPNRGHAIPEIAQYLPAKWNKESTIEVEVKKGSNQHDFEVQTKE